MKSTSKIFIGLLAVLFLMAIISPFIFFKKTNPKSVFTFSNHYVTLNTDKFKTLEISGRGGFTIIEDSTITVPRIVLDKAVEDIAEFDKETDGSFSISVNPVNLKENDYVYDVYFSRSYPSVELMKIYIPKGMLESILLNNYDVNANIKNFNSDLKILYNTDVRIDLNDCDINNLTLEDNEREFNEADIFLDNSRISEINVTLNSKSIFADYYQLRPDYNGVINFRNGNNNSTIKNINLISDSVVGTSPKLFVGKEMSLDSLTLKSPANNSDFKGFVFQVPFSTKISIN